MTTNLRHLRLQTSEAHADEASQSRWPASLDSYGADAAADPGPRQAASPPDSDHAPARVGPLVAVCGLCGGAGASTLTYLLAASAALRAQGRAAPVLALDAGGVSGGLSLYCGEASPRSLAEIAEDLRHGRGASTPLFATAAGGVRVIATAARPQPDPGEHALARILADARAAHQTTIADCGALALPSERLALRLATQVIWMLPATEHGLARAGLSPWMVSSSDVVQLVVARHEPSGRRASTRALARLADDRQATLVLMPHVPDMDLRSLDDALEVCGITLQALEMKLAR
jgi:hypothetical protein